MAHATENGHETDSAQLASSHVLRRRGLIAGAAALVTGILARQGTAPVAAADGSNLILGAAGNANNTSSTTTTLTSSAAIALTINAPANGTALKGVANGATAAAIEGVTDLGDGVLGVVGVAGGGGASGSGVHGQSFNDSTAALYGESMANSGVGVYGLTELGGSTGVFGDVYLDGSNAVGGRVRAGATASYGIYGEVNGPTGAGVFANSFDATSPSVLSQHLNGGVAVDALASGSHAVRGTSTGQGFFGVVGVTTAGGPFSSGVVGIGGASGSAGVVGGAGPAGSYAGFFSGTVVVDGDFYVMDPTRKHGAIQAADGTLRTLYSMESPESWIEDFGSGKIKGSGGSTVTYEAEFAGIANTADALIFLTANGNFRVWVERQSATGFVVSSDAPAGSFVYRVVARPKSERSSARLAPVKLPKAGDVHAHINSIAASATAVKPHKQPKLPTRPRANKVK